MSNLQLRLNQIMKKRNVTVNDIEKNTKIGLASIKAIANGNAKNPTIGTLQEIANFLNVNIETLFTDDLDLDVLNEKQLIIYQKACESLTSLMIEKKFFVAIDTLCVILKEVYQYAVEHKIEDINSYKVDVTFLEWIFKKYKKFAI